MKTETPIEMLALAAKKNPNKVYLRQPINRVYHETTWAEAYDQVLRLAAGLQGMGLQAGDKVAIVSENCAEWFLSDFAIVAAGLIPVPIYFTAGEGTIRYVLEHSEAKAVIVGKLANSKALVAVLLDRSSFAERGGIHTISMPYDSIDCDFQLRQLIADNPPLKEPVKPKHDDMFSICYTSGSTGKPKGVVLTFANIIFGAQAVPNLRGTTEDERVLSYLPLAHIVERAIVEYGSLYVAGTVTFNESLQTFKDDLYSAQVTSFVSVPRLWMKFQAGILAEIPQKKLDVLLRIPIVSRIVKNKIKDKLGLSKALNCGSGSAPISPSILQWYRRLDIPISEGWGMTEVTGLAASLFPYRADKVGSIGTALDGFEIKLSDTGEVLIRGDAVFKEYYKNPEATAEALDSDGWLSTGDRAKVDEDGFLTITGRVKELFKSGKGKYVAPVPIESLLAQNQLIEQLCVMGSGLPAPVAVLALSIELTEKMDKQTIENSLKETLFSVNQQLEKHEQLDCLYVVNEVWSVDNGLLTPTLKIKRDQLEAKYNSLIEGEAVQQIVWQ